MERIELPLKFRCGVTEWGETESRDGRESMVDGRGKRKGIIMDPQVKKCLRLYPQDNDSDGFFVSKIVKKSERGCE